MRFTGRTIYETHTEHYLKCEYCGSEETHIGSLDYLPDRPCKECGKTQKK